MKFRVALEYINTDNAYRAIALPIANSVFIAGLQSEIPKQTTVLSPQAVIEAGPTNVRLLTDNPSVLHGIRVSYLKAVKNSLYLALAAVSVALFFGACMEWKRMEVAPKVKSTGDLPRVESHSKPEDCREDESGTGIVG